MSDQEYRENESSTESASTDNVVRLVVTPLPFKRAPLDTDPFTPQERKELRELMEYIRTERPIYEAAKQRCTILSRLTEG